MALPEPWDWQERDRRAHALDPKRAIFASPRIGKSLDATLQLLDAIKPYGIGHGLVTAPLVVTPQWTDLLQEAGFNTLDLHDAPIKRAQELLKKYRDKACMVIVNDDKLQHLVQDLLTFQFDAVIGDESHRWRGVSTKRAKAARRVCWEAKWVRLLTGTPTPNHYGNLWGQMVALDKQTWFSSYGEYADRYLIRDAMFPTRVLAHNPQNVGELQTKLLQFASIVRREDVFGPDQYEYVDHPVELPAHAAKLYDTLAREWLLDVDPFEIETTNVLARLTRLRQLASGYLPTPQGDEEGIHDEKIQAVLADLYDIVDSGEKSSIFYQYLWEGRVLEEAIAHLFPNVPLFTINGSNSRHGVQTAQAFCAQAGAAVCIVQTSAGGVGISLAESENAQFVSQSFDFDAEDQALARIYKPGARRTVMYYPCSGTVDDYIREILATKQNIHESVRHADRRAMAFGNIRSRRGARIGAAVKKAA